jgi:uncharacterized repeat protein (TIGR03803 family)
MQNIRRKVLIENIRLDPFKETLLMKFSSVQCLRCSESVVSSWIVIALVAVIFVVLSAIALPAQTFTVLYNFPSGGDGANPTNPGLIAQGRDGNLYSTTLSGCGPYNLSGEVFRVSPLGKFKAVACLDSAASLGGPYSGVTMGTDGKFYGTSNGGDYYGSVWKVSTGGKVTAYNPFTAEPNIFGPIAPPVLGMDGSFYGTTASGGSGCTYGSGGCGGIFKITSAGKSYKILHSLVQTDGANPDTSLLLGTDGNLYGTTSEGGSSIGGGFGGGGVIFKITSAGTYTVLYNLCSMQSCLDGEFPYDGLVEGTDGNFYGTANGGGTRHYAGGFTGGVIFQVSPTGKYKIIYNFCSETNCDDGANPLGGLVQASDGTFYGTTQVGGTKNYGTIFQLTPAGEYTVLYNFDSTTGAYPDGTLVQDTNGILYGDTHSGGTVNDGTFFSIDLSLPPFAKLVTWWGKPGAKIGILGQGFKEATSVLFNGTSATFKTTGDSFITATVPAGATSGSVTVVTKSGTLSSSQTFEVQ